MAQEQSPSMSIPDSQENGPQSTQQLKSDSDVPIDPLIFAPTSQTYANHQQQYSPYIDQHGTQHYPGHPWTPMGYPCPPEWVEQYLQQVTYYGHPATSGPPVPVMVSPVQRPLSVSNQFEYPALIVRRVIYALSLVFHCLLWFSQSSTLTCA
jgi:hypothetical protein